MKATLTVSNGARDESDAWLRLVRDYVRSLEFGSVQIVVHGSRVVQVDRTEKIRFPIAPQSGAA